MCNHCPYIPHRFSIHPRPRTGVRQRPAGWVRRIGFGLCAVLVAGSVAGCGDKIESGNTAPGPPASVSAAVATAKITSQPFVYQAVGTVKARTASTVSGKLMGIVKAVHVSEGDTVKQGDVLVVVDDRQVTAQLRQAEAALAEARRAEASARSATEAARARADLARSTYQRYLKLIEDDSASQQEFEEIASRHKEAEATLTQTEAMLDAAGQRVQQAEAGLAAARVGKKDAAVRAPYDGKVTAKMVEEGDLASPGTPFLTLEKKGAYCVDLVLPERHIQSVELDQPVQVAIPGLDRQTLAGRIGRIVPTADQQSRTFLVKVALPDGVPVRSGMFARVAVPVGKGGMILIPATAVVWRGQLTGLYILDEENIAHFRLIRIGRAIDDAYEVLSGLADGDRYVVTPPVNLANGNKVEVRS